MPSLFNLFEEITTVARKTATTVEQEVQLVHPLENTKSLVDNIPHRYKDMHMMSETGGGNAHEVLGQRTGTVRQYVSLRDAGPVKHEDALYMLEQERKYGYIIRYKKNG
jgi:hypothetical protein